MSLFESSRVGWEDSNSNNFKQNYFYLDFYLCTNILHLFLQNISFFLFIFSSLVSVHIMVYNCTSCLYIFGCRNRNRSRNSLVWKCRYSNLPVWVGKIRIATISNKTTSTSISICAPTSYTYSYKIFHFFNLSSLL